jgi:hypothetical protein
MHYLWHECLHISIPQQHLATPGGLQKFPSRDISTVYALYFVRDFPQPIDYRDRSFEIIASIPDWVPAKPAS